MPAEQLPSTSPEAPSSLGATKTKASGQGPGAVRRIRSHLRAPVRLRHADLPLLICCLISGLVDSAIYRAYGTFVSMQTGNTIFVGLGGSTSHTTTKPYGWAKSLLSIGCFCLGCVCFSHMSRFLEPKRRGTLAWSFAVQAIFVLTTAAVVQGGVVEGRLKNISDDIEWTQMLPIGLLSFQSAGQLVGSRALEFSEIPTVVVTSMLHDISTDTQFFGSLKDHPKRNRRILAFSGILVGAVAGGFIGEKTGLMQVPLWIAGGLKVCIAAAWTVWPPATV